MEKEKCTMYGVDEDDEIKYQYVKVVHPIRLGIGIAVGMFIMFPLFIFLVFIILLIFGGALASLV